MISVSFEPSFTFTDIYLATDYLYLVDNANLKSRFMVGLYLEFYINFSKFRLPATVPSVLYVSLKLVRLVPSYRYTEVS